MSEQEATGEKAVGKRQMTEQPFENSEVCKKMRSAEDFFSQVKPEEMEQLKGTMAAFYEICDNVLAMSRKNAELSQDVEISKEEVAAAKVVAENAIKKADESNRRAEKAEKALDDWMKAFQDLSKKAEEEAKKKTEKAEKDLKDWKKALEEWIKAYDELSKKAEDSRERAEKAEKALKEIKKAFHAIGSIGKALNDFENGMAKLHR